MRTMSGFATTKFIPCLAEMAGQARFQTAPIALIEKPMRQTALRDCIAKLSRRGGGGSRRWPRARG